MKDSIKFPMQIAALIILFVFALLSNQQLPFTLFASPSDMR